MHQPVVVKVPIIKPRFQTLASGLVVVQFPKPFLDLRVRGVVNVVHRFQDVILLGAVEVDVVLLEPVDDLGGRARIKRRVPDDLESGKLLSFLSDSAHRSRREDIVLRLLELFLQLRDVLSVHLDPLAFHVVAQAGHGQDVPVQLFRNPLPLAILNQVREGFVHGVGVCPVVSKRVMHTARTFASLASTLFPLGEIRV
jgi:hypothetical protein